MQAFLKAYTDMIAETIARLDPVEFRKAVDT